MPGKRPDSWSSLMAEFVVTDIARSVAFWTGPMGFSVAYDRPAEKFVFITHPDGAQIMLWERDGSWETGPLEPPFGRGVVTQVYVRDVDRMADAVRAASIPFYVDLREKWRHWGDREGLQREFLVQDPDGYLVMVAARVAERPLTPPPAPKTA